MSNSEPTLKIVTEPTAEPIVLMKPKAIYCPNHGEHTHWLSFHGLESFAISPAEHYCMICMVFKLREIGIHYTWSA